MQLKPDSIILYPTDTLYALGVDATNPEMVRKLKELKGRNEGKPISIAVDSIEMMKHYAEVTPLAQLLAKKFLPGKLTLTLILKAKCSMSRHRTFEQCILAEGVVAPDGSVGVRIPNHPRALALIRELGKPLTATSANVSSMETESTPEKILAQFGDKASWITHIIDEGALPPSGPSTVVDARGTGPVILREGAIAASNIIFGPQ